MKVLFICNQNENRSRTAEELFMQKKILSLDIPDVYYPNQHELANLLKSKINELTILINP